MNYKGTFTDIFEAIKAFPDGADREDRVLINGVPHRWSRSRGTWVTDQTCVPHHMPEMPISLFVSLTDNGVLTDWQDRKWQLERYQEDIAAPTITIEDVTDDYIPGSTGAYNKITIATTEKYGVVRYKIERLDTTGTEVESIAVAETVYTEPVIFTGDGKFRVSAYVKEYSRVSETTTEEFELFRVLLRAEYDTPEITTFKYNTIPAEGGIATPGIIYTQKWRKIYTDNPDPVEQPEIKSDATAVIEYTGTGVNKTTGELTVEASSTKEDHVVETVKVTVTLNGRKATSYADIMQEAYTLLPNPLQQINAITGLKYTGKSQILIQEPTTNKGAVTYAVMINGVTPGSDDYMSNIPEATLVGTYTIYWKCEGNSEYLPSHGQLTVSIGKAESSVTIKARTGLKYNGNKQDLIDEPTLTGMTYAVNTDASTPRTSDYTSDLPTGKDVATYTIFWKYAGDAEHAEANGQLTVSIAKAENKLAWTGDWKDKTSVSVNPGTITFQAEGGTGTITYMMDATSLGTTGSATINDSATIYATIHDANGNYEDKTIQMAVIVNAYTAYWGFSSDIPTTISTSNPVAVDSTKENVIPVTTDVADKAKCHWVAMSTSAGFTCTKIADIDGDTADVNSTVIGDYTVWYYKTGMNIVNTFNFTLKKQ